jgi:hypothetical protein
MNIQKKWNLTVGESLLEQINIGPPLY